MDLHAIIDELLQERDKLNELIRTLEAMERKSAPVKSRRGRKSMNAADRREVSERMRRYWAKRKQAEGIAAVPPSQPAEEQPRAMMAGSSIAA